MEIPANIVLVLGGGNGLGAYHAGAYQALDERGIEPTWIAGASIGAVVGAIILGNAPDKRMAKLRDFWRTAEQFGKPDPARGLPAGGMSRFGKSVAAIQTLMTGRPGLFRPRLPGAWSALPGTPDDVSIFETIPLLRTLHRFIDFDRLNAGPARFIATAVDVETGEDAYFDTAQMRVEAEHLRASTAFPVVYPPVEIGGRTYVDPGISANMPIRAVLSEPPAADTLCLAVDLVSGRGKRPRSLGDAVQRAQDLIFSNHSRHAIEALQRQHRLQHAAKSAAGQPAASSAVTVLQVIYANDERETAGKMFDYSSGSIGERWTAGHRDMLLALDRMATLSVPDAERAFSAHRLERGSITPYAGSQEVSASGR